MLVTNGGIVIIMTNPQKNSLSNKEVVYICQKNKINNNGQHLFLYFFMTFNGKVKHLIVVIHLYKDSLIDSRSNAQIHF